MTFRRITPDQIKYVCKSVRGKSVKSLEYVQDLQAVAAGHPFFVLTLEDGIEIWFPIVMAFSEPGGIDPDLQEASAK